MIHLEQMLNIVILWQKSHHNSEEYQHCIRVMYVLLERQDISKKYIFYCLISLMAFFFHTNTYEVHCKIIYGKFVQQMYQSHVHQNEIKNMQLKYIYQDKEYWEVVF